jgi:superfamily I DNA/RNA helicase
MICDEAQDVQPFWWESIECALRNEDSCYYIFFDRSQGVFGSGSAEHSFVPEDVLPIPGPYFPLIHNYRTTKEIAGFSRAFRTGRQILMSHSNRLGYVPEVISYVDADDGRKVLGALLNKLCFDEGVNQDDITILSARRAFHDQSIFEGNREIGDFLLRELGAKNTKVMGGKKCVNISTVASFKGLETRVAIVCNFSEYQMPFSNPIMSSLMYVACTRAKHMLYLLVRKDDPKRDFLMKSLDSLQRKGPLTVGDDSSNHSYIGTISYFNPDRLGWIKIEENSGQSNHILFLSSDVKHLSRENLKIGSKLSFRVKQEGFISIAVDIQMLGEGI